MTDQASLPKQATSNIDAGQRIAEINRQAQQDGCLPMWTVFDHPRDYPGCFIARCSLISGDTGGSPLVTQHTILAPSLKRLRSILQRAGLKAIMRAEQDDPNIVETWL